MSSHYSRPVWQALATSIPLTCLTYLNHSIWKLAFDVAASRVAVRSFDRSPQKANVALRSSQNHV